MTKILKKVFNILISRLFIIGMLLLLQVIWFIIFIEMLGSYSNIINSMLMLLSLIAVLWLVNKQDNPAYKLAWVIPILIFPLFGGLMYLFLGNKKPSKKLREKMGTINCETNKLMVQDTSPIWVR